MNLTSLFGKQVVALYEGETVGTISGATFNNSLTKIHSFKVFDEDQNEYELLLSSIKKMQDCVIINNKQKLSYPCTPLKNTPMFKVVLDDNAKNCGKIVDAEIDENGEIKNFISEFNKCYNPKKIYLRKNFVFYSEKPIIFSNLKPKTNLSYSLSEIKVNVLDDNILVKPQKITPPKVQFNPESILGRVAKSDLLGINNEIIIKTNQVISEKTIDEATRHNRLNQLFYIAI